MDHKDNVIFRLQKSYYYNQIKKTIQFQKLDLENNYPQGTSNDLMHSLSYNNKKETISYAKDMAASETYKINNIEEIDKKLKVLEKHKEEYKDIMNYEMIEVFDKAYMKELKKIRRNLNKR